MKEYNEETHFPMPRKSLTVFKWFQFIVQSLVALVVLLGVTLLLLWSIFQVVLASFQVALAFINLI